MISSNRPFASNLNIALGDHEISLNDENKFLGLVIDKKVNFESHIRTVCRKVSRSIGILYKLKEFVPQKVLVNIYYSLVYPYLLYGNLVWGGSFHSHLQPLFLLQKRAVRIIKNTTFLAHTDPIFSDLQILKLEDIHKFLASQYIFKHRNSFRQTSEIHSYNTRQLNDLAPDFQRLTISQNSIFYFGPLFWNSLPNSITECNDFIMFKRLVRSFLIDKYQRTQ